MAEVLIPPDINPEDETIELVDDGSHLFRPSSGSNVSQVQQDYEPRIRVRLTYRALRDSDRARMIAALRRGGGKYGTFRAQVGRVQRGSFPSTELLTNNTFANGTTGWTAYGSSTLSVSDRVMRINLVADGVIYPSFAQSPTVTAYAPYAARAFIQAVVAGTGDAGKIGPYINNNIWPPTIATYTSNGLATTSAVSVASGVTDGFYVLLPANSGFSAGHFVLVPWTSFARCFLIDNGPNLLTYSDQFENAAWSKSDTTVTGNNAIDPEGGGTGDDIEETATTAAHFLSQSVVVSSSAADFSFSVAIKANGRTWGYLRMSEGSGSSQIYQTFDLSNGVVGSTSSVGANWSNLRSFIRSLGNGWYYCSIVGRKTNAATTLYAWVGPSNGDSVNSYLGTAGYGIRAWRATLAQSSVPTRLVQSTSAAVSATAQTGSALYVKGLPASTSGLLAADDVVEVNGELLQLTASLDSDAAGLGYLQFAPSLFRSPDDSDPVIVNCPLPKFKLMNNPLWPNQWGKQSDFELVLEQVYE